MFLHWTARPVLHSQAGGRARHLDRKHRFDASAGGGNVSPLGNRSVDLPAKAGGSLAANEGDRMIHRMENPTKSIQKH